MLIELGAGHIFKEKGRYCELNEDTAREMPISDTSYPVPSRTAFLMGYPLGRVLWLRTTFGSVFARAGSGNPNPVSAK